MTLTSLWERARVSCHPFPGQVHSIIYFDSFDNVLHFLFLSFSKVCWLTVEIPQNVLNFLFYFLLSFSAFLSKFKSFLKFNFQFLYWISISAFISKSSFLFSECSFVRIDCTYHTRSIFSYLSELIIVLKLSSFAPFTASILSKFPFLMVSVFLFQVRSLLKYWWSLTVNVCFPFLLLYFQ